MDDPTRIPSVRPRVGGCDRRRQWRQLMLCPADRPRAVRHIDQAQMARGPRIGCRHRVGPPVAGLLLPLGFDQEQDLEAVSPGGGSRRQDDIPVGVDREVRSHVRIPRTKSGLAAGRARHPGRRCDRRPDARPMVEGVDEESSIF